MSTRIPRAHETVWAQEAMREHRDRPADVFRCGKQERKRIDAVMDAAVIPDGCSREIPVAPARGPVAEFRELRSMPRGDGFVLVEAPYRAGRPGRARDIFDTMTDQTTRRGGEPPFTRAQVGAARDYRALHERVQSAGVKCSRAFDVQIGGQGQGQVDFMDAYIRDTQRLAMFHRAIGDGVAMSVRQDGANTMDRGSRWSVTDTRLVEMVCIGDKPLNAVLKAHGWSASSKGTKRLRAALCAALERMQGI